MNVGIDIVEVKRIKRLATSKKFLNRIFTEDEIKYCNNKKNKAEHFAVRFAAKEAIWKAISNKKLTHKDINIKKSPEGKPEVVLPAKLKKIQNAVSISLSHTKNFAVAIAVSE